MSSELKEVRVADMSSECSYPLKPNAIAMSDCCRNNATTAVEFGDGTLLWRCEIHRGLTKGQETGAVHETVLTRQEVHESLVLDYPERE